METDLRGGGGAAANILAMTVPHPRIRRRAGKP